MRLKALILILPMMFSLCGCSPKGVTVSGFAMDTEVSITVYGDSRVADDALKAVEDLEKQLSWSVPSSAVAELNRTGECDSKPLAEILNKVYPLCDKTDGEYSLLMRELCALWDVTGERTEPPSGGDIANALSRIGGAVEISGESITLPDGGMLDLGSVGKGAACDNAAAVLNNADISGIISVGGSIVLCGDKPDGDWTVSVAHPDDRNRWVGTLTLKGGKFISTSGDGERYFEADGVRYHHIISGVTGYPAVTDVRSVTVVGDSGVITDALSTACFLVGYDRSADLLKEYDCDAVFVMSDDTVRVTDGLKDSFEVAK